MPENSTLVVKPGLDPESGRELYLEAREKIQAGRGPLVLDMASVERLDSLGGASLFELERQPLF